MILNPKRRTAEVLSLRSCGVGWEGPVMLLSCFDHFLLDCRANPMNYGSIHSPRPVLDLWKEQRKFRFTDRTSKPLPTKKQLLEKSRHD